MVPIPIPTAGASSLSPQERLQRVAAWVGRLPFDLPWFPERAEALRVEADIEHLYVLLADVVAWTEGEVPGHSRRVAARSLGFGRSLKLTANDLSLLYWGGLLHDIGKLELDRKVIDKPGPLTAIEWACVEQHALSGARLLHEFLGCRELAVLASAHHERWDGSGYPEGLREVEIPPLARVLALTDVFDALTSARSYRTPMTPPRALEVIREGRGSHFDPWLAHDFAGYIETSTRLTWGKGGTRD